MTKAKLWFQLGLGVFMLVSLTACPGPGGSPVSVVAAGVGAAAYRVQGGDWQTADDPEHFTFRTPGAYEVALRCGDAVEVYALTTGDGTELNLPCDAQGSTSFLVSYDASAVAGAHRVVLYYKDGFKGGTPGQASGTISVSGSVAGTQDLVLTAEDNSGALLAARMLTADVQNGGSYSIVLQASDAQNLLSGGSVDDFSAQVPSGWGWSSALAFAVTPRGTLVPTAFLQSSGGAYTSFRFADHDGLMVDVRDSVANTTRRLTEITTSSGPGVQFTPRLPSVFSASVTHEALPEFAGLSYNASGLLGYNLLIRWGSGSYACFVSTSFLGSRSSHRLPDLSAVPGFTGSKPASGNSVEASADAVVSNVASSRLLRSDMNNPLALKELDLRLAGSEEEYTVP